MGTPAAVPEAFVVDLREDTGMMDRGEAELLITCPGRILLLYTYYLRVRTGLIARYTLFMMRRR